MGEGIVERLQAENAAMRRRIRELDDDAGPVGHDERLRFALRAARGGVWDWNLTTDERSGSPEMLDLWGTETWCPEESLAQVHEDDRENLGRALREAIERRSDFQCEFRIHHPQRGERWISSHGRVVCDSAGVPRHLLGISLDVTDRVRAEEELRRSEERFRATFESAAVGIAHLSIDGKWLRFNDKLCEILGYSRTELGERTVAEVTHLADLPVDQALAEQLLAGEIPNYTMEKRYVRADGSIVWSNLTVSLVRDRRGEPDYVIGFVEDITARKQAEAALAERTALLNDVLESTTDAVYVKDPEGRYLLTNPAGARALGKPRERIEGHLDAEVMAPDAAAAVRALDRAVLDRGTPESFEVTLPVGSETRVFHTVEMPLRSPGGDVLGLLAIARDITERKQMEEELVHQDRRKDEFLAMLAHELRNPLAPIRTAVHLLRQSGADEPVVVTARDLIDRQVTHLARLVDDLLDVARVSRGKIQLRTMPCPVAAVVQNAVDAYRARIDQRHQELTVILPPEPVRVEGDFTRLTQVVENLLSNASKYTGEGGRIWVTVEAVDGDGPGEAVIRVRDTGRGMDPAALETVFDLFFQESGTLDRSAGGLGIGLSLVRSLVRLHGGVVTAHSGGHGTGSEFVVRLPRLPEESPPPVGPPPSAATGTGHRILVVDDNRDVAESMAMLLQMEGHEVLTAYDGQQAVDLALEHRPDVVLLDIGLPTLDGYQACRAMREGGLDDAIIVAITGYGQDEDRRKASEAGFDAHQVKPVDPDALMEWIDERAS